MLNIEVGKVYTTKNGRRVKVIRRGHAAYLTFPFTAVVLGSSGRALRYSRAGIAENMPDEDDSMDLVEQVD